MCVCVRVCVQMHVCDLHSLYLTTHLTIAVITVYFLALLWSVVDHVKLQPITGLYMTKHYK